MFQSCFCVKTPRKQYQLFTNFQLTELPRKYDDDVGGSDGIQNNDGEGENEE